MNPKEKAKYLIDKYFELSIVTTYNGNDEKEAAKQCALIAAKSSKDAAVYTVVDYKEVDESEWVHFKGYWQEVKQEIEEL